MPMTSRATIRTLIHQQRRMADVLALADFYAERPTPARLEMALRLAAREEAKAERLDREMRVVKDAMQREIRKLRRRVRGDA